MTLALTLGLQNVKGSGYASGQLPPGGAVAPRLSGANPRVTGSPYAGRTLTTSNGGWSSGGSAITFSYTWWVDGEQVDGATSKTYVVQGGDVGKKIASLVLATNAVGEAEAGSNLVTIKSSGAPINTLIPSLSGRPIQGQLFAASGGTWNDNGSPIDTFSYQWYRNGFPIESASALNYTPTEEDFQRYLQVSVEAENAIDSTFGYSVPSAKVAGPVTAPVNFVAASLTGLAQVNQNMAVALGEWNDYPTMPSYSFRWFADDVALSGETLQVIALKVAHLGKKIKAEITATNFVGQTVVYTLPSNTVVDVDQPIIVAPPVAVHQPEGIIEVAYEGEYEGSSDEPTYQWFDSSGDPIPGATDSFYEPQPMDGPVTVVVTVPGPDGETEIELGPFEGLEEADMSPQLVLIPRLTVSPSPHVGSTMQVIDELWDFRGEDPDLEYEWLYVGPPDEGVPDATGQAASVNEADAWKVVHVKITATNTFGITVFTTNATPLLRPAITAPVNLVQPTISGIPKVGQSLSTNNQESMWDDGDFGDQDLVFDYQWMNGEDAILGATGPSYILTEDEIGGNISLFIEAENSVDDGDVTTEQTAPVAENYPPPTNTVAPTITGTAEIGEELTAHDGTWTGNGREITDYLYTWLRNNVPIPDEDGSTYEVQGADIGKVIKLMVTSVSDGGQTAATSVATSAVPDIPPENTVAPVVTGFTVAGQTLTTTNGTWISNGTAITGFTYQWKRGGVNISGATGNTRVLAAGDIAANMTCQVTAQHAAGNVSALSNSVGPVDAAFTSPVNTVLPVISGTLIETNLLSTTDGTWTTNGQSISDYDYQWRRDNSPISGATNNTYTLVTADVGHVIDVVVTAINAAGSTSAVSLDTATIVANFDVDARAFINAMTGTAPNGARELVIEAFFKGLKVVPSGETLSPWDTLKIIGIHAAHTTANSGQAQRINARSPTHVATQKRTMGAADLTFTTDRGMTVAYSPGSYSTNLNWAKSYANLGMTQNDAMMAVWIRTVNRADGVDIAWNDDNRCWLAGAFSNTTQGSMSGGSALNTSNGGNNTGMSGIIRSGASASRTKKRKVTLTTSSNASAGVPSGSNLYTGEGQFGPAANEYTFTFVGLAMTDAAWDQMVDTAQAYMTAVGA